MKHFPICRLLVFILQYWEALKICMDQHVEVTEDLAEKLTPSKEEVSDTMERVKILEAIAEVCMHQGQYHLATKKFTQAGNKMKASAVECSFFKFIYPL